MYMRRNRKNHTFRERKGIEIQSFVVLYFAVLNEKSSGPKNISFHSLHQLWLRFLKFKNKKNKFRVKGILTWRISWIRVNNVNSYWRSSKTLSWLHISIFYADRKNNNFELILANFIFFLNFQPKILFLWSSHTFQFRNHLEHPKEFFKYF